MQSTVGTIVKSGDHGEPIGVLSVLNTQRYKDLQCLKEIRIYLTKNCKAKSIYAALEKVGSWDEFLNQAISCLKPLCAVILPPVSLLALSTSQQAHSVL